MTDIREKLTRYSIDSGKNSNNNKNIIIGESTVLENVEDISEFLLTTSVNNNNNNCSREEAEETAKNDGERVR